MKKPTYEELVALLDKIHTGALELGLTGKHIDVREIGQMLGRVEANALPEPQNKNSDEYVGKSISKWMLENTQSVYDQSVKGKNMYTVRQEIDLATFLNGDFEMQNFANQEDANSYIECVLEPQNLKWYQPIKCTNGLVMVCEKWT